MVLQIAQGVGDSWGVSAGSDISLEWSDQGARVVSGGRPEGGCPLRNSGALIIRSNSAVRATRAEYSMRFLSLNYAIEYVTTHLQEIPQRIR